MTARTKFGMAVLAAAIFAAGCAPVAVPGAAAGDAALLHADHPLAGRIWRSRDGAFVTEAEVHAAVARARFVLLGEKHDNPQHHRIQTRIVERIVAAGTRPALVFEMLTESQQSAVDAYLTDGPADASGLGAAVGWESSGWPDWAMYRSIVDAGLAVDAPVLAGGLDRETIRGVMRDGAGALGEQRSGSLRLEEPIPPAMRAGMRDEIHWSHCEQLPESMLDPMVTVTLAKDAVMAARMIEGTAIPGVRPAVLIAGDGHVRADRGVPWHLAGQAPGAPTVTVGIVEVVVGRDSPKDYAESFDSAVPPFDFVWFTPRVDDKDPCEVFADQLRNAGDRAKERDQDGGQ